jgi:A/G-specific adenine glycosylase
MELGALVCTARRPKCPECPVRADCLAVRSAAKRSASDQRGQGEHPGQRREDRLLPS